MTVRRTKEQFENAINASPFLCMREESGMEAEYTAAFRRFAGDLYAYVDTFVYADGKLKDFGLEFMQTVKACLVGYDREKAFLNYFLTSLSTNIKRVQAKRKIDEKRMGVNIGKKLNAICKVIFRYVDSKGLDVHDERVQERIAESFRISPDVVKEALLANYEAAATSNISVNEDGDEVDLFDLIADKASAEAPILEEENLFALVADLEGVYAQCRKDTQRTVRYKLTALLIKALDGEDAKLYKIKQRVTFFADEVYDVCKDEGDVPKDNRLAAMCGVSPPSFSRAYDTFKVKLMELRKSEK